MALEGYINGLIDSREERARAATYAGNHERAEKIRGENGGNVVVPASAEKRILESARVEATAWTNEIEAKCRQVLLNAQGGAYDREMVGQQLAAVPRSYLEDVPEDRVSFAKRRRGRRMKIQNEEAHKRWQRERHPITKQTRGELLNDVIARAYKDLRLKRTGKADRKAARETIARFKRTKDGRATIRRRLKKRDQELHAMAAQRREYSRALVQGAVDDEGVVYLQWTTMRDSRVCSTCDPYDLWIVKKGDMAVANFSPPLHPRCRCYWVTVSKDDARAHKIKPTAKAKWPDFENEAAPAPGFGRIA